MSSSKPSRMNRMPAGSKFMPRASKMMNQSKIKKSSKGSASKLMESRFMSRMKSSMVGGKYGKSGYRKKGSSKYSTVRENGDPIIYREGVDVTPLPIQIDDANTNDKETIGIILDDNDNDENENEYNLKSEHSQCFIPLIDPIYHPMSMSQQDDKKEYEKEPSSNDNLNNRAISARSRDDDKTIICTENDHEIDIITNSNEFNQYLSNNPHVLDENVMINLCETNTQIIFEMPSLAVSNRETSKDEREMVMKMNQDYQECVLKHSDKDLFTTSYTQTYNPPIKDQSIHVLPPKTHEQHTQSSNFDIYDAFKNDSPQKISTKNNTETQQNNKNRAFPPLIDLTKDILQEMQNSETFQKNLLIMERAIVQNVMAEQQMLYRVHATTNNKENRNDEFDSEDEDEVDAAKDIKTPPMSPDQATKPAAPLKVEIDINPIDPSKPKEIVQTESGGNKSSLKHQSENNLLSNIPHLQLLWNYSCRECENIPCTALDFNPLNTDLIVGGYGSWKFANEQSGKIMFWTLKNPTNPSRIYNIDDTCVVSLNFSRIHPYLLSVGLFDGSVAVYDIRIETNEPILKSELNSAISDNKKQNQSSSSKHTTPVWNVLWEKPNNNDKNKLLINDAKAKNDDIEDIEPPQNQEKIVSSKLHQRHKLFSIASDGIIKQWSMKKGFMSTNIMSLKRVPNLAAKRGSVIDNTIRSRQGSGLCFDFPSDTNNTQYYVGTEDGIVHKCSVSYNEQVLRTYYGHTGPVHRVQCSPFDNNKFITCSADWTMNIWSENKSKPLLSLNSNSNESIIDCCWSPFNSCIFASASERGILSIWNLEKNKKDAIITKDTKCSIKQIMFAPNAPAILSAQSNGNIQVYRLNHINTSNDEQQQQQRLNKALESDN